MNVEGLDERALRDLLEQTQGEVRKLVALEQRGFELETLRAQKREELARLEAKRRTLLNRELVAREALDRSADALVEAMEGSAFRTALTKRERWWLMRVDGGQLAGTGLGLIAGVLVTALGIPVWGLAIAGPLLVLFAALLTPRKT
ncbi:MAG: hypothetical protein Q8L48_43060 [Archangium sp.]|nr:hypothetical protein [Archangium sp.]